nr:immunoglobulin light chain junction region [Macaca mulatta]
CLQGYDTPLTF